MLASRYQAEPSGPLAAVLEYCTGNGSWKLDESYNTLSVTGTIYVFTGTLFSRDDFVGDLEWVWAIRITQVVSLWTGYSASGYERMTYERAVLRRNCWIHEKTMPWKTALLGLVCWSRGGFLLCQNALAGGCEAQPSGPLIKRGTGSRADIYCLYLHKGIAFMVDYRDGFYKSTLVATAIQVVWFSARIVRHHSRQSQSDILSQNGNTHCTGTYNICRYEYML